MSKTSKVDECKSREYVACPKCGKGFDWLKYHSDGSWEFWPGYNIRIEITHCPWCGHELARATKRPIKP